MKNLIENIERKRINSIRINHKKMFKAGSMSNKILSDSIELESKDINL